jgi:drug/metabolite transporter (DMT)-like permease
MAMTVRSLTGHMVVTGHMKGIALAVLGSILWGASGISGQFLLQFRAVPAEWLTAVRMIVAGILLLAYDAASHHGDIFSIWKQKREAARLILFSVVGMLGVQYTYFAAILYSNAPTGTILQYMMPIIILAWTALRSHTLPGKKACICCALAIIGTFLIVTRGTWGTLAISPLALFWGLLSAVAAAFYTVQPQGLIIRWRASLIVGWAMLAGGLIFSPIARPWQPAGDFDTLAILALIYVIVVGTAIAFWLYLSSLKYIEPSEAGLLNSVEPLSSIVLSMLIFHLTFGVAEAVGAALIICTVLVVTRQS